MPYLVLDQDKEDSMKIFLTNFILSVSFSPGLPLLMNIQVCREIKVNNQNQSSIVLHMHEIEWGCRPTGEEASIAQFTFPAQK